MKLDKTIQPLSRDTTVLVRSRSVLGLKYIQLSPGRSAKTFKPGDTLPLAGATAPVEFDDFLNTFDQPTRENSQAALVGFGDALAARGPSLNQAIEAFNPFFTFLQPVATNLADPRTTIDQFFKQIGATSAQVAPVARTNETAASTFGRIEPSGSSGRSASASSAPSASIASSSGPPKSR